YLPGQKNPIALRPNSPELFLLARARDEAHRFSNRGRKRVGRRRSFASELEALPGIGPKTRTALLKAFGSLASIRAASDEALLAVPGVTRRQVVALRTLGRSPAPPEGTTNVPSPRVDATPLEEVAVEAGGAVEAGAADGSGRPN
ncbi:MAG TPA: helix-hairpin-helix domain-containing protein, partial [Polyangiaceae bacterium]